MSSPRPVMVAGQQQQGLRGTTTSSRSIKKPFICTVVRRMLGIKMATCSQNSRTLYMNIKAQLDTALGHLATHAPAAGAGEAAGTPVCPLCRCLMILPVCLPCGHSLCKPCLARSTSRVFCDDSSARCPRCHQSWPVVPPGMEGERRPTVVLQNAFMRWYPGWAECCRYREEGNRFAQEGNFAMAVQHYNKALETGKAACRALGREGSRYMWLLKFSDCVRSSNSTPRKCFAG